MITWHFSFPSPEQPTSVEPDVHHIDFRVGKILTAKKHPDADTLFVEESEFMLSTAELHLLLQLIVSCIVDECSMVVKLMLVCTCVVFS